MRRTRLAFALTVAGAVLAFAVGAARAAPTTIDFEQLTGPSVFCGSPDSPLIIGDVTFTGGKIMTAVSNFPANRTTVYGTSLCPNFSPTLTITFARPASHVSLDVYNGIGVEIDYTVASDVGDTQTKTLPPHFDSGQARFTLADRGITTVTISGGIREAFWDFFIDNIEYTVMPTSKDECKNGGWQSFGVFKNQGDCVSYVATGGRNQPG